MSNSAETDKQMEGGIRQENTKLLVGQLDVTLFITIKLLLSKTKYSPPATKLISKNAGSTF
jgi:hypothetical protein